MPKSHHGRQQGACEEQNEAKWLGVGIYQGRQVKPEKVNKSKGERAQQQSNNQICILKRSFWGEIAASRGYTKLDWSFLWCKNARKCCMCTHVYTQVESVRGTQESTEKSLKHQHWNNLRKTYIKWD
jgi:hypothetical protein